MLCLKHCRCTSRELCVRNALIVIFTLFVLQLSVILFFYNNVSLLMMFNFDWLKQHQNQADVLASSGNVTQSERLSSNISSEDENTIFVNSSNSLCPAIPHNLQGRLKVDTTAREWPALDAQFAVNLMKGGRWKPLDCLSRHKMAIVIPYRDREKHLKIFVQHMHPLLQRQQIDYGIYVIELAPKTKFNRALLMNIGFAEVSKIYNYECYIFHDVDLYPEDDRNIYSCPESPRHMSVSVDKFKYKLPYPEIFGGVGALKTEHFKLVNGFSNKFFGWGGEDDDMHNRIVNKKLKIIRYHSDVARYKMMSHSDDVKNPQRFALLNSGKNRWNKDGLNSLVYDLVKIEYRPLYTWINVNFNVANVMASR